MMHIPFVAPFLQGEVRRRDLRLLTSSIWVDELEAAEVDVMDKDAREVFDRDEPDAWDIADDGPMRTWPNSGQILSRPCIHHLPSIPSNGI